MSVRLDLRPAQNEEIHNLYYKSIQEPVTRVIIERKKTTTTI